MNKKMEHTMNIIGVGDINFVRSWRARYTRISITNEQTITVTMPPNETIVEAQQFLFSKLGWIRKQLARIRQNEHLNNQCETNIDLDKAQDNLYERLVSFAKQYNFPFRAVAFRSQKTKWGSCSHKNNINLNVNIAFLPSHLQDYVLLHELCHLRHKGHKRDFWSELNKYTGGKARELSRELKKYNMRIF